MGELWCLMPWLSCFIGGVYRENYRPATSVTNFITNFVSSNKGILIADTTNVKNIVYLNSKVYELPFTEIAMDKLGTILPTNILSLAFLVKITGVVSEASLKKSVSDSFKPQFKNLNLKAIRIGFKLADNYKE